MNLLTIRTQARLKSGIAVADFSNANLDVQANEGYYQLAALCAAAGIDIFEAELTFNLAANTAKYNLPSDFMLMKQLRLAYTAPVNPEDYRIARGYDVAEIHDIASDEENASAASPIVDLTGVKLKIKPTPAVAVTNGGLLIYQARPSALALTGDVPVIPLLYHDLIPTYAARMMCQRFEKEKRLARLDLEWFNGIARIKSELAEDRNANQVASFRSPYEGGRSRQVTELGN